MQTQATQLQPALNDKEIDEIVQDAVVWANQHGLVVALGSVTAPERAIIHAPLAALPVAFPRARFEQAKAAQTTFNALVDKVARDESYLESVLAGAAAHDTFTGRLLSLLKDSRAARAALAAKGKPEIALGVHRSDYMLDAPSGRFLQVEINTIASSFGCLSALMTRLHNYVASRLPPGTLDASTLPPNVAIEALPAGIAAAAKAHGAPGGIVVMVVQPGERNAYDQQWLQLQLWERHGLRTLRRTLGQIAAAGRLSEDGTLTLVEGSGSATVSVVYFRAGYTPADYPSEAEWEGRSIIERSNAAKCPTVAYQLAGAKKVQQDLARPGVLERFLPPGPSTLDLRQLFAGLWGLDDLADKATAEVVDAALARPEAYVLKPQREGGGNNLYGTELVEKLQEGRAEVAAGKPNPLAAYILMQKILPPPQRSVLVRSGAWEVTDTLSELGVYGTFVRKGDQVLLNTEAGHLVRTKRATSNEGGVAAGFAVLDSPRLV
eukprot:CAMPEP_0202858398 /NCGR_PEP_ID=MMETSP1391-20130828/955_1 /ASSEMBLY_ACC=CAM_ASM_000867 /TAXON_ID=1034604 /ORGANISM="Chlamydomonas leiostraca, Strain SAG 11-49" /LENGTH=492 /DNA_ID=CAMNT_0049537319 /DNA_START=188 /DNA_END=1666 /DNA_ORIENTATION=-